MAGNGRPELRTQEKIRQLSANGSGMNFGLNTLAAWPEYFTFGTPARLYRMGIGLTSTEIFIAGPALPHIPDHGHRYDPSNSSTSKPLNRPFKWKNSQIEVRGQIYRDQIGLPENKHSSHSFGVVETLRGAERLQYDGQVGIAWKPYANEKPGPEAPIIHWLVLDRPFNGYQILIGRRVGALGIGSNTVCGRNAEISYIPLMRGKPLPMIAVRSFEIDKFHYGTELPAFVDFGNGPILLPDDPFKAVIAAYRPEFDSKHGFYTVDCRSDDHAWELDIGMKGNVELGNDQILLDAGLPNGKCLFLVLKSPEVEPAYTLGLPFFYRYCVTYDIEGDRIGLSHNEHGAV